jgi:Uncharacterized protein conserved in bacteria
VSNSDKLVYIIINHQKYFSIKKIENAGEKLVNDFLKGISLITQIGINLFITIFLGLMAGKFLDNLFNTKPIFLIIFILLGIAAAFRNLFIMTKKYFK